MTKRYNLFTEYLLFWSNFEIFISTFFFHHSKLNGTKSTVLSYLQSCRHHMTFPSSSYKCTEYLVSFGQKSEVRMDRSLYILKKRSICWPAVVKLAQSQIEPLIPVLKQKATNPQTSICGSWCHATVKVGWVVNPFHSISLFHWWQSSLLHQTVTKHSEDIDSYTFLDELCLIHTLNIIFIMFSMIRIGAYTSLKWLFVMEYIVGN